MSPSAFPRVHWFVRTVRVLPVVAAAALGGGVIGGFAVLAIDLALTSPSPQAAQTARANETAARTPQPIRTIDPANQEAAVPAMTAPSVVAAPAAGTPAAATPPMTAAASPNLTPATPAAPQSDAPPAAATLQAKGWPDALSRQHAEQAPKLDGAAAVPPPAATAAAPIAQDAPPQEAAHQAVAHQAGVRGESVKKRVAKTPRPQPANEVAKTPRSANENASLAEHGPRRVYDYYEQRAGDRDEDGGNVRVEVQQRHAGYGKANSPARVIVRRQQDDSEDESEAAPRPRPFFFGLFGGGPYGGDDDDQ